MTSIERGSSVDASLVMNISIFVLILLRFQPHAEDFHLHTDVVEMPAS
jgi:hypothetical protein